MIALSDQVKLITAKDEPISGQEENNIIDINEVYGRGCRSGYMDFDPGPLDNEGGSFGFGYDTEEEYLEWAKSLGYTDYEIEQHIEEMNEIRGEMRSEYGVTRGYAPDEDDYDVPASARTELFLLMDLAEALLDKITEHYEEVGVPLEFYQEYLDLYSFVNGESDEDFEDEETEALNNEDPHTLSSNLL